MKQLKKGIAARLKTILRKTVSGGKKAETSSVAQVNLPRPVVVRPAYKGGIVPINFIAGDCNDPALLRHQILTPVKAELNTQTGVVWYNTDRTTALQADALDVSLFPAVPGNVLLTFDLADRGQFSQLNPVGLRCVNGFQKVLVSGSWMRRKLLNDTNLTLCEADVIAVGAPRIDLLRKMMADVPAKAADAPLTVLFAPLHKGWVDGSGVALSCADAIAPYLEPLGAAVTLVVAGDTRNTENKRPITADLLAADIVITDFTALIYEAWALGKPVIFPHWLVADRVMEKSPHCAEAHIYRERIGHHADSFDALMQLLSQGRALDLGQGVDAFMSDYLENWRPEVGAPSAARLIAQTLERLADPALSLRETQTRAEIAQALTDKNWAEAETLLAELLIWNRQEPGLHEKLARALGAQRKWWQEVAALEAAVTLAPNNAMLFLRLGKARQRMGRHCAAASSYAAALRLAPEKATSDWFYRLGYVLGTVGTDGPVDEANAALAFAEACARDTDKLANLYGVGALHAAAGRWRAAQIAYRDRLSQHPFDAGLQFRLGTSHERCYEWAEAERAYIDALALAPHAHPSGWYYQLGFVLERQSKYDEAATAYLQATSCSPEPQPTWFYRAGYALEKAGRLQDACAAYSAVWSHAPIRALANPYAERFVQARAAILQGSPEYRLDGDTALRFDFAHPAEAPLAQAPRQGGPAPDGAAFTTRDEALRAKTAIEAQLKRDCRLQSDWQFYSAVLEMTGDVAGAASALAQAILRSDDHQPVLYHRLGLLHMQREQFDLACDAFRAQRILQRPHGVSEGRFATDAALRVTTTYREFHDTLPVVEKTVLYEAFSGVSVSCNPLAIFRGILDDPRFAGWTHIWSLEDMSVVPRDLWGRENVVFVRRNSTQYLRFLATAQYLVQNSTFPTYFVRRPEQEYLNTWHGTPLKSLGYDIVDGLPQIANTARNFLQTTLMISPNAHTEHVLLDRYGIRDIYRGTSMITGYPRVDSMLNATAADIQTLKDALAIDPSKPTVLYAPTYRGLWESPELEAEALIADLRHLESDRYNLIFRGHYFAEKLILDLDLPITVAKHEIDSCSLLAAIDVLITDYSSIFFDFMPSRRPIIHYIADWEDYTTQRGSYFAKEQLPGQLCDTIAQLQDAVDAAIADPKACVGDRYVQALAQFGALEDGRSAERVIDAFFFRKRDGAAVVPTGADNAVIMYCGAWEKNGISASAAALLNALKDTQYTPVMLIDRTSVIASENKITRVTAMLDKANVLVRSGATCHTLEERWVQDGFNTMNVEPNAAMQAVQLQSVRHEARRILGDSKFRLSVDFSGYGHFFSFLMAQIAAEKTAIYLHNDMYPERVLRFPALELIFQSYAGFDALISVSDSVNEANIAQLSDRYSLCADRFKAVPNMLDVSAIHALSTAEDDPDFQTYQNDTRHKLICVARMSPEKNHYRLLDAFEILRETRQDVALYLVGDGPIRARLQRYCNEKHLTDAVVMLGLKENPYPFIRHADCLVLSSDHEGQGIVLLEAMTLGVPCVSTDISGPRSVLAGGLGVLADLTPQAMATAITQVLDEQFTANAFDADAYNAVAMETFLSCVGLQAHGAKP